MRLPSISAVVIGTAVGLSGTISLHCPVWAQGVPPATQGTKPSSSGGRASCNAVHTRGHRTTQDGHQQDRG